nr:unnamed protein product [Callosobruchus chinensis]
MSNIPQTFLIILKLLGIYPSQRHAYKCYVMVLIAASMCSFGSVTYTKDAEALVQQRNLIAVKLFALATVGQLVYGEAHSTIAISYRSINELEAKDLPELHFIKTELLDLIQQVHIRNPKVIASSFFDVNFSMAGFVVASITSYIIVALQFMVQGK